MVAVVLAAVGTGCGEVDSQGGGTGADEPAFAAAPGALVEVSLQSRVGVVLDEIPSAQRAAAASYYLAQPDSFWEARARQQIRHTQYRLTYRNFFYDESEHRRTLALPAEDLQKVVLGPGRPTRVTTRDGHDAVQIAYTMRSALLTDRGSPGAAEPSLARVGGVWREPYNLPLDPEFLFQRTGFACVDEDGYPPHTAESENIHQLFDQECDVETPDDPSCHITAYPKVSCLDALARKVGRVDTSLRFERVAYRQARADQVRLGTFTQTDAPDLAVLGAQLANNWVEYRYFPPGPDTCALQEKCVGGPGWRRLLLFDASMQNRGARPLSVGTTDETSPPFLNHMFEFSQCHQHYHFRHYGDFSFGSNAGDKRAFCVESTDRYFNNELTPLVHDFGCDNQGVAVGWGDTYIAGVECNWIDVTDVAIPPAGVTQDLKFVLNPDKFICEGTPVVDGRGRPVYETTAFRTEDGKFPVGRPVCDFAPGYDSNNTGTRPVLLPPAGGLITTACTRQQAGPLRDCGFTKQQEHVACPAGKRVELSCTVATGKPTSVARLCDDSAKLGGIACMYADSLANTTVGERATRVSFTCPASRGADEPGGTYSVYVASVLPDDAASAVTCTVR